MPNPQAAFHLIQGELEEFFRRLKEFPKSPVWVHETTVSNFIGLPRGKAEHGQVDAMTCLLDCAKKGFGGNRKKGTRTPTGMPAVDLQDQENSLQICYQQFGQKEEFLGGELADGPVVRHPRWFHFGDDFAIEVKRQLDVVNNLIGNCKAVTLEDDDPAVLPLYKIRRRQKLWKEFFVGSDAATPYLVYDVPDIAAKFIGMWEGAEMNSQRKRRRSFDPELLEFIETDFRLFLVASNSIGKFARGGGDKLLDSLSARAPRVAVSTVSPPRRLPAPEPLLLEPDSIPPAVPGTPPARARPLTSEAAAVATAKQLPDSLKLQSLKCTDEGFILWDVVGELASVEMLFVLHVEDDFTADAVEAEMKRLGVPMPATFDPLELRAMSGHNIKNARKNIKDAREDLLLHLGGFGLPAEADRLYDWQRDMAGYTAGRRLEASIWTLNERNRQEMTSVQTAYILRHIFFSYNIPLSKIGPLWACYYALIMRREIPDRSFLDSKTIWNNVQSLWSADNKMTTQRFLKRIRKRTKHGFRVMIYLTTDDSKYFKRQNRHVAIISDFEETSLTDEYISVPFDPTFRLVTTSPNQIKTENYLCNANDIINLITLEGAAYLNGGLTDNASDALKEVVDTDDETSTRVGASEDPAISSLTHINGVKRRPVGMGDPYHWGNLGTGHASRGMSGDTVNQAHEQCHHLQLLQSTHSLHSDDPQFSQAMMDRVMGGPGRVKVKTMAEKKTRWLFNQRNATWMLGILAITAAGGEMCLVAWALWFANNSRSDWKKRVGQEIATWLSMPAIILGLHFEAELSNYFEQAFAWHNRKGPFHSRSGFRMMEIHDFFWDFELAWWNSAIKEPERCMPKTMKYLADNFSGEELGRRRKQIMRGLRMGRDEVIKITKRYLFKPPILLLLMTHRHYGPAFLRAVLAVLSEHSDRVPDVELIKDTGGNWAKYLYDNADDRPAEERLWYNLLTKDDTMIDDLIHFWRQFCLNWPCLVEDLQALSRATPNDVDSGSPLTDFASRYPVLFECLYAVFGAMMSNSRLCEQIHGMMRFSLRLGIGMDQADHHRQYGAGTDYGYKEARRMLGDGGSKSREDRKKAVKHDKTKEQIQMLNAQILQGAEDFAERLNVELSGEERAKPSEISKLGRRDRDKKKLAEQVASESAKALRLRRKKLTIDDVKKLAAKTKPTNDATFTFDRKVLQWRDGVAELIKVKFWGTFPKPEYERTWRLVEKVMIHMGSVHLKDWTTRKEVLAMVKRTNATKPRALPASDDLLTAYSITSYARAEKYISEYIRTTKVLVNHIYSYISFNDQGSFRNKSVQKDDIRFLFFHYQKECFEGDVIQKEEEAIVDSLSRAVDQHFSYTIDAGEKVDESDDEDDAFAEEGEGEYDSADEGDDMAEAMIV